MNIQWFPGHMAKTKRLLAEKLKIVDMAIIVADARAPKSTLNPDFDDLFKDKRKLIVLNKSDLADEDATRAWVAALEAAGETVLDFSSVSGKPERLLKKIDETARDIKERYALKGVNKTIRAMTVGIPNVGKSALLNRLAGRKKLKEGNRPGVTRGLQWVKLGDYLELMDTPGVLAPRLNDRETAVKIACLGAIREEILNVEELALEFIGILRSVKPEAFAQRFGFAMEGDALHILEGLCKKRGFWRLKANMT